MARRYRINKVDLTDLVDENGEHISSSEYRVAFRPISDEEAEIVRHGQQAVTESGHFYHAGMSPEVMRIAACEVCRRPPRRFLLFRAAARRGVLDADFLKHCSNCGIPLCPRHTRYASHDRSPRCPWCHRRSCRSHRLRTSAYFLVHKLTAVLRFIFFEKTP